MNKVKPSTEESDRFCYGTEDDSESGYHHTGWYITMPQSRRKEVARYLGIPSIYCIGVHKDAGRVFIQTSRSIDPRNKSVEYVEVDPWCVDTVMEIIERPVTDEEHSQATAEFEEGMRQAREGRL